MHVRVVRFMGGCAFWSKRVVPGVVCGLCADCPGVPPCQDGGMSLFLLNIHNDSLLRPSTLYYISLFLLPTTHTTPYYYSLLL